ncbi:MULTISPECIES: hypothetical protein [unclassified Mycobacterium]|uniref:hypothetical protein n=1 Tax=unclassified Mycobacterium TaxID=2642494 RepID=UPI0029C6CA07|nr:MULTISPECIES: hypothetical protein [unclassified Mycobacterium]
MKRIDLADSGGETAAVSAIAQGEGTAVARSEVNVYVVELNLVEGAGYISAHRTKPKAEAKLVEFARRAGLIYAAADDFDDNMEQIGEFLDDHPDVESYAVMTLPVED